VVETPAGPLDPDRPFPKVTKTQHARYVKALDLRERTLNAQLAETRSTLNRLSRELSDPSLRRDLLNDGNPIDEEYARTVSRLRDYDVRTQLLGDARKRLADSRFGRCLECHVDIAPGRLELFPELELCAVCNANVHDE
jgi:RNA polymerase-binding transcription factor DksA